MLDKCAPEILSTAKDDSLGLCHPSLRSGSPADFWGITRIRRIDAKEKYGICCDQKIIRSAFMKRLIPVGTGKGIKKRPVDVSSYSFASRYSQFSFMSVLSIFSAFSILSIGSAGSILSIGSSGSILSIGSVGSILSIGSAGSILSIGRAGGSVAKEQ